MNVDLGGCFSSLWTSAAVDIEYNVDGGEVQSDEGNSSLCKHANQNCGVPLCPAVGGPQGCQATPLGKAIGCLECHMTAGRIMVGRKKREITAANEMSYQGRTATQKQDSKPIGMQ
jgi:hypothetical protein